MKRTSLSPRASKINILHSSMNLPPSKLESLTGKKSTAGEMLKVESVLPVASNGTCTDNQQVIFCG